MIPYGRQDIHESDISAVLQVLKSDFLTQGPVVPRFEDCIARHCGARRAVAVNSATSALHIALLALGVGSGDLVWTSPNTFVASSNAALYCGATIDFVDIDPDTYNMSVVALERKLVDAKRSGQLPKVVIPVHIAGQPCDMERINALATLYSFSVVEDASHAIGAKYKGDPIGNCRYSDIAVFSFHPVKIITTAEGGMAVTNDDSLADKMELYRSHGVTRDPKLMSHPPDGSWYYQQVALGYNYRITEIQAALGLSQMQRLEAYIARRHEIAARYDDELAELPINLPFQQKFSHSAYHLYIIRLQLEAITPRTHAQVFQGLRDRGINVNLHYIPVHTQPYYQSLGFSWGDFPNSEEYYRSAISIPMYPKLTYSEQSSVIKNLYELLKYDSR
jgi:UDP-4-amino-4,6-dideoxy-N-acetyl-beta-L-altrosamine transaminase